MSDRKKPTGVPDANDADDSPMAEAATRDLGPELTTPEFHGRLRRSPDEAAHLATSETTDLAAILTPKPRRASMADTLSPSHDTAASEPPVVEEPAPADLGRYRFVGHLGRGGMGQVVAVHDPALQRELAMKILMPTELDGEAQARFLDEAQLTAQLQHPGVVPVHEIGRLSDGQTYFTMQVVRGRTLRHLIEAYHEEPQTDAAGQLYRLITVFNHVCETIAFAHRHGIIHRDLKPENVMVGEFGEVRVLDWGLAKRIDAPEEILSARTIRTHRESEGVHVTLAGEIMGTPVYMSPEQARGQNAGVSRATDVYALGAVLFHLLAGKPPFEGAHAMAVMMRVVGGLRSPLEGRHPIPRALREICDRGMLTDPTQRYADAGMMQEAVAAWLSGTQQRERALQLVAEARAVEAEVAAHAPLVERAAAQAEAMRRAALGAPLNDEAVHQAHWAAEDAHRQAQLAVERLQVRREQLLHSALTQSPEATEARTALARYYQAAHTAAELRGDAATLLRTELLLREQAEALPPVHPDRAGYLEYLGGEGLLNLNTLPAGASVAWHRYVPHGRRLVAEFERELRPTPLRRAWLPRGSHLIVLRAAGCAEVRYPVAMDRLGRWEGDGDATNTPGPIVLPAADAVGPDECFIAPGPCVLGGDPEAFEGGPRQSLFLPGYVVRRTPVTNGEYLAFVNDLAMQGRAEEAMRYAPRVAGATQFTWKPDLPVVLVDRACALAYAAWLAAREGRPWRLPTAREWEKAARGVDARLFPWGDFYHAAWTNLRERAPTAPQLAPVATHPVDESPYGVCDLAGNVREWTADDIQGPEGQQGIVKGGGYLDTAQAGRAASRNRIAPTHRDAFTGFRLVRSL
jgi:tRNA A-37 threonylcarbamoyl transferase component Bud32